MSTRPRPRPVRKRPERPRVAATRAAKGDPVAEGAAASRADAADVTVVTVGDLMREGAQRFQRARLTYGHGTDNPLDEAAALAFHALKLEHEAAPAVYGRAVSARECAAVRALFTRRVRERIPAAYLMRRMWFMGLEFYVDERVLVPRSPLAELIAQRFAPWIAARRVRSILDLGTGSGCIAIACARSFPRARVDAVDISPAALTVARRNIRKHRLITRVRAVRSDLFSALRGKQYDVIVSNPPYVGEREFRALPAEYRHEPAVGLLSGREGLDAVRVILREAAAHLTAQGILIVEVGNSEAALRRAFPRLPFTWLQFEHGGGGVFLLTRSQL